MSDHVMEWLNAYLDGEVHGSRLQYIETHLAECDACRAELASLEKLSDLLQEAPAAEFTPPERFAAQVSLRLPRQRAQAPRKKFLEIGWWMVPVGLLTIWVLMNAWFFIYDALSVVNRLGFLTSASNWTRITTWSAADWSSTLGQLGVLRGTWLGLARSAEMFTKTSFVQITLQVSIALLYLSWLTIWWTRYQRQRYGRPLEN